MHTLLWLVQQCWTEPFHSHRDAACSRLIVLLLPLTLPPSPSPSARARAHTLTCSSLRNHYAKYKGLWRTRKIADSSALQLSNMHAKYHCTKNTNTVFYKLLWSCLESQCLLQFGSCPPLEKFISLTELRKAVIFPIHVFPVTKDEI